MQPETQPPVRGLVFHVQRYCVDDGPGIRTTVFLKGCPLHCVWCHNPEGISGAPQVMWAESRCLDCGECITACPAGVLAEDDRTPERCTLCGTCVETCPVEARQLSGRYLSVEEVVTGVVKDRLFFDESGGGVTFSGGEPLAQPEFLLAALAACRAEGIHTVVDTSGFCPREDLLAVARLTDLFLYDLKVLDDEKHRRYTGESNRRVLDNLATLATVHDHIWVRVPVIPDVNDGLEDLETIVEAVARLKAVRRLHLLPYHPTGNGKLRRLGRAAEPGTFTPPTPERMRELAHEIDAAGLPIHVGG